MYKVEFLNDVEFEALPYPDMHTSLGVADPKLGRAYVRRTGIPMVDYFNMAHELEHLEDGDQGVHADHKRNGVYYKGLFGGGQPQAPQIDYSNYNPNPQTQAAPNVVQTGGGQGSAAEGATGSGTADRIRGMLSNRNQSGGYAGR